MMTLEDDDIPQLPEDTLAILESFLKEKARREHLQSSGEKDEEFEENWQLSQFWYNEKTKSDLTKICQHVACNESYKIGLLSCPSLYLSIKQIHQNVKLFEYDRRFESFGEDFIYYDFNQANIPYYLTDLEKFFDLVIVDPPFLSEDCIEKVSKIVRNIIKSQGKIIFCSGEVCQPWIEKFLGLTKCAYQPEHERNLGNAFATYSNFELDEILQTSLKAGVFPISESQHD